MSSSGPPQVALRSAAGWRLPRLALLVAAVVLLALSLQSASAAADSSSVKPTIVLVHGAWADGSSWNPVTQRLQRQGYTVLVPPNPLRSLSGDAAYISAFIQQRTTGPVVLVGRADNVIPPVQQRAMAERADAKTVEVNAGHLSMLSRPGAVTDLITAAARSVH
jgi:pimeloyl-ACP methyl ester carboxylesterase